MKQTVDAGGAILLSQDTKLMRIERPKPGVMIITVIGGASADVDKRAMDEIERDATKHGKVIVFCDMRTQARLAAETREYASAFAEKTKGKVEAHILVKSKLIEMALSVISMFSGSPLHMYSDEKKLIAAIAQELPGFTRLPDPERLSKRAG